MDITDMTKIRDCLLQTLTYTGNAVQLDSTENRVDIYNTLIGLSNIIKCVILPLLSGYVAKTDKYKQWKLQNEEHVSPPRKLVVKEFNRQNVQLREMTKFENKVVVKWNPMSRK